MRLVKHRNLGICEINDACEYLQAKNPDPTSIFVEYEGDIREVTKVLVEDILVEEEP